ncbi:hypothetical protein [Actinoplanes sp. NPDC051494]|uniref:hypothetical protein n=1 Tax=Actinoplanes sp. NPDC051494 TaxID=3363907 RepID=UPI0037AD0E79
MPDLSLHTDPDDLAVQELAAATPALPGPHDSWKDALPAHHGADDPRQAARERSGRAHSGRAAQGGGRSYAFRRS